MNNSTFNRKIYEKIMFKGILQQNMHSFQTKNYTIWYLMTFWTKQKFIIIKIQSFHMQHEDDGK